MIFLYVKLHFARKRMRRAMAAMEAYPNRTYDDPGYIDLAVDWLLANDKVFVLKQRIGSK